jgi:hypothetical protein
MALQSADRRERYGDGDTTSPAQPRHAWRRAMDRDADHLARRPAVDLGGRSAR